MIEEDITAKPPHSPVTTSNFGELENLKLKSKLHWPYNDKDKVKEKVRNTSEVGTLSWLEPSTAPGEADLCLCLCVLAVSFSL